MQKILPKYKKLVFATHNEGKIKELDFLFKSSIFSNIEILKAADLGVVEPREIGSTFEQNALIKAQYVASTTKLPSIADDSGLCIEALDDFPGVRSAELAEELGNNERDFNASMLYVLDKLTRSGYTDKKNRHAKFVSCLCLCNIGEEPKFFRGEIKGIIAKEILGKDGFGYDSIFIPLNASLSFGQMNVEEKNSYPTHRVLAMQKLLTYMEQHIRCV